MPVFSPLQHRDERLGRVLETLDYLLAILQLALFDPLRHLRDPFAEAALKPGHDESFHLQLFHQDMRKQARTLLRLSQVVLRDLSADRDPAERVHARKHGVGNAPAHVIEVAIDAIGAKLLQLLAVIRRRFVIERAVEAQLLDHPIDLFVRACDPHHPATLDLGDLSN